MHGMLTCSSHTGVSEGDTCSHFQIPIMEMEQCHRNPLAGRDSVDEVDLCYR